MQGLNNLKTRLNYMGGNKQQTRMNVDKLRTLQKALLYSYQAATAELEDGRQFRCLINPDKIKNSYDNKYISIPFEDILLNPSIDPEEPPKKASESMVEIGMKPGDVFTWVENGTNWLVYLQRLEETAYFRAEIRRCKYSITIGGKEYKCYFARNTVNEIDWRHQKDTLWNDLDYSATMYITKDEATEEFFHRFKIVNIANKPWEVQAIDSISSDGIIIIALKEWYKNDAEAALEQTQSPVIEEEPESPRIVGKDKVYPYDVLTYTLENIEEEGQWSVNSQKIKILQQTRDLLKIEVITGKSGEFEIQYTLDNENVITLPVKILSL